MFNCILIKLNLCMYVYIYMHYYRWLKITMSFCSQFCGSGIQKGIVWIVCLRFTCSQLGLDSLFMCLVPQRYHLRSTFKETGFISLYLLQQGIKNLAPSHCGQCFTLSLFLILIIQMGESLYLIVVLNCISLVTILLNIFS